MLIVHKIIESLLHGKKAPPVAGDYAYIGTPTFAQLAAALDNAEKFDFGTVILEPEDIERGFWRVPVLTDDEVDMWSSRLLPLPSRACWYEFTLNHSRSGLLIVTDESDEAHVCRFDYSRDFVAPPLAFVRIPRDSTLKTAAHASVCPLVNDEYVSALEDRTTNIGRSLASGLAAECTLAVYFTLMLNSRTTERCSEVAPVRLNKKRTSAGRPPLYSHSIVNIVPQRYRDAAEREVAGTHRSPRLHWRRSHLRHFEEHTPHSVWAPMVEHKGHKGWWVTVIPRMLVGKAELGEVSHEYRVRKG